MCATRFMDWESSLVVLDYVFVWVDNLSSLASAIIISRYESTLIKELQERVIEKLGNSVFAILFSQLENASTRLEGPNPCLNATLQRLSSRRLRLAEAENSFVAKSLKNLQQMFQTPSPAEFAAAFMVYALTTLTFHRLHNSDRYQNRILVVCVIISGLWAATMNGDGKILRNMAFTIWVSLSLGAVTHSVARTLDQKQHKGKEENKKRLVETSW